MEYAQSRIYSRKCDAQTPWEFEIQKAHLMSARRTDIMIVNKKKNLLNFAIPVDPRVKLKARPCKRTKNTMEMKVTELLIVIGLLSTVTKALVQ